MRGVRLRSWEVRAILLMDHSYLRRASELSRPESQQVADAPLTPSLFDGMFK